MKKVSIIKNIFRTFMPENHEVFKFTLKVLVLIENVHVLKTVKHKRHTTVKITKEKKSIEKLHFQSLTDQIFPVVLVAF